MDDTDAVLAELLVVTGLLALVLDGLSGSADFVGLWVVELVGAHLLGKLVLEGWDPRLLGDVGDGVEGEVDEYLVVGL